MKLFNFDRMIELIIYEIPPSNNKFQGTGNRHAYQKIKKYWADLIYYEVINQKIPREKIKKSIITLKYYFKDKRRHDPDNYSGKFILDGLVKAGVLLDDSFNNIELVLSADVDSKNSRTEIKITEVTK